MVRSRSTSPNPRGDHRNASPKTNGNGTSDKKAENGSSSSSNGIDREKLCPMLLRVFSSTSRHNPLAEYNRGEGVSTQYRLYCFLLTASFFAGKLGPWRRNPPQPRFTP